MIRLLHHAELFHETKSAKCRMKNEKFAYMNYEFHSIESVALEKARQFMMSDYIKIAICSQEIRFGSWNPRTTINLIQSFAVTCH